jgi:acyl-coenzyme A thioesterase 9
MRQAWKRGFGGVALGGSQEPVISSTRTGTTSLLWKTRVQKDLLDEAARKAAEKAVVANLPPFLVKKSPQESHVSVELSFASNPSMRDAYASWMPGSVRFGKILEDLDALAGNIAHSHADDNNPLTRPLHIVTACVDRVDILRPFRLDVDLTMFGNVSYVGRSSMHIHVAVAEKEAPENQILTSSFLMVARDATTGKSAPVNHLEVVTDEEKMQWLHGEQAKDIREQERALSIANSLPTGDELLPVHQIYYPNEKEVSVMDSSRVPVKETVLSSVSITQPQERNTKDSIFGGYLMRKAYELGMAVALKFCGAMSRPLLLAVDEITFHRPVEIGSIISFTASVVFSTK